MWSINIINSHLFTRTKKETINLQKIDLQTLNEPDFIGETIIANEDGTTQKLEKNTIQVKTNGNATLYIFGIGSVKSKISIDGCCSKVIYDKSKSPQLIIRAVDNETDPASIISIFKFKSKKNSRKAELSSLTSFIGSSENNLDYVKFEAKNSSKNLIC